MTHETASDQALMRSLKDGDARALAPLVERWERRLLSFVYRYIQDETAARDLVQETFVRVYRARDKYDLERPFSTWMFGIAANLCRNRQRWLGRHPETGLDGMAEPADWNTPAEAARLRERDRELAAAVASLPHTLRVVLLLHYYEGLSYGEIAGVVDCSLRGVESRLYRARRMLARKLGTVALRGQAAETDPRPLRG